MSRNRRAIQKVTSGKLLTRQATIKKLYYIQKNAYILKLLLNIVTARTEALVISGNKFMHACVKKSAACELSHVLTPSICSSLLMKHCDLNQFIR
jgi:hypothetical protein